MSIVVTVDGQEYEGFIGISAIDNIENLCNTYSQECSAESGGESFPIKRGASVKISVEGVTVFSGYCEVSDVSSGKAKYSVSTRGRDINRDIIKSSLDPSVNIKGPISLVNVIKKTLKASGIDRDVIDETGGIDKLTKKELLNDDVGTDIWDYWIELARKRQTLITDNVDGDIILFRPGTLKYRRKIVNRLNDNGGRNNVISSNLKCDDSNRCHQYVVHSQYNFSAKRKKKPKAEGVLDNKIFDTDQTDEKPQSADLTALMGQLAQANVGSETYFAIQNAIAKEQGLSTGGKNKRRSRVATQGTAYDYSVPPGSVRHIVAKKPSDDDECRRLAEWHSNLERANSVKYTCSQPYLLADDAPWKSGYLIDVVDEDVDIDATMLITNVAFKVSKSQDGSSVDVADLTMTIPDAYTSNASADSTLISINRIGGNWNDGIFQ